MSLEGNDLLLWLQATDAVMLSVGTRRPVQGELCTSTTTIRPSARERRRRNIETWGVSETLSHSSCQTVDSSGMTTMVPRAGIRFSTFTARPVRDSTSTCSGASHSPSGSEFVLSRSIDRVAEQFRHPTLPHASDALQPPSCQT